MDPIYIFICLILFALLWKLMQNRKYPVTYVKSLVNGKQYLVRNLSDKQAAADILGNMNIRFNKLIEYIQSKTMNNTAEKDHYNMYKLYVLRDSKVADKDIINGEATGRIPFKKFIAACHRLVNNYNPDAISENTPDSAYTSYSENKGQRIVFCIRAKRTNKMVDLNTMMFVGIHELAHLMTQSIGHTDEFWENMRVLLRISIRLGIYDCKNYNIESKDYCGTKITDTPLKCGDV